MLNGAIKERGRGNRIDEVRIGREIEGSLGQDKSKSY